MIDGDCPQPPPPPLQHPSSSPEDDDTLDDDHCLDLDDDRRITAVCDTGSDEHDEDYRNRQLKRLSLPREPETGFQCPPVAIVQSSRSRENDENAGGESSMDDNVGVLKAKEVDSAPSESSSTQIPPSPPNNRRLSSSNCACGDDDAELSNVDTRDDDEEDEEDDDEFGDFEEFSGSIDASMNATLGIEERQVEAMPAIPADGESSRDREQDDNWAMFSAQPSSSSVVDGESNDDWVANFANTGVDQHAQVEEAKDEEGEEREGSAASIRARQRVSSTVDEAIRLPKLAELVNDPSLWSVDATDPDDELIVPDYCIDLFVDFGDGEDVPESGKEETGKETSLFQRARELWLSLRVVEETRALQMQWTNSTARTFFHNSLNVDAQVAKQRQSNLPAFAQHLGVNALLTPLTPVAAGAVSTSSERPSPSAVGAGVEQIASTSDSTLSPSRTTSPPVDASTAREGAYSNSQMVTSSECVARPQQRPLSSAAASAIDSLAVPPAQFDWTDSGLSNPLTGAKVTATSAILDLDFLLTANDSNSGMGGTGISTALQRDLDAFGLSSRGNGNNTTDEKPSVLEELMRKSAPGNGTSRAYKPISELSLDARALCDALPNLDFMFANVLMFPIGARR